MSAANARVPLRTVAIVGNGPVALLAAAAFAQALPQARVTVVAPPDDPAALADRLPIAPPSTLAFLATLGLTAAALVAAGATPRIGEAYDWGTASFTIGEGDGVPNLAGVALHQLWLARGAPGRFDALVPAAAVAAADRFTGGEGGAGSLAAGVDHALRLDPVRSRALFASRARGVPIRPTATVAVERDGDTVAALVLDDGARVHADLFVDASGDAALLAAPDAARVDWSGALPVDRLLLATGAARVSPVDRYAAMAIGWTGTIPLADRTLRLLGYAGSATTDARAARQFGKIGERIVLRPGRRVRPFAGNVLALGDAAAVTGPLGMAGFALACSHLALALELLPAGVSEAVLAAEYNRRATLRADRVRDHVAAFYAIGSPRGGEFWHPLRQRPVPDTLDSLLAQFRQRGTLPLREEETVSKAMWIQALIGLGIRPLRSDPMALSVPATIADGALDRLRVGIAGWLATLPRYGDYLATASGERR